MTDTNDHYFIFTAESITEAYHVYASEILKVMQDMGPSVVDGNAVLFIFSQGILICLSSIAESYQSVDENLNTHILHHQILLMLPLESFDDAFPASVLKDIEFQPNKLQMLSSQAGETLQKFSFFNKAKVSSIIEKASLISAYDSRDIYDTRSYGSLSLEDAIIKAHCQPQQSTFENIRMNFRSFIAHSDRDLVFETVIKHKQLSFPQMCAILKDVLGNLELIYKCTETTSFFAMLFQHAKPYPCLMKILFLALVQSVDSPSPDKERHLLLDSLYCHLPDAGKRSYEEIRKTLEC